MEKVIYEIPETPHFTIAERNKLIKQAADSGVVIFFKGLIPLYWIRYWTSRFYLGPIIALLIITVLQNQAMVQSSNKFCYRGETTCLERSRTGEVGAIILSICSLFAFGICAGSSAKKARDKLGISRKEAIAILPAIRN